MFLPNTTHKQDFLEVWSKLLSPEKLSRLEQSSGYAFYKLIFCNIAEEDFQVLYSSKKSAPNSPVNCLVAALFLLDQYKWSFDTLMKQIEFNVEIRVALGLKDLESIPFVRRTLFNFKNRLYNYNESKEENLLEKVFLKLTASQIKELGIKTGIQRGDSVLLNSNIGRYSRLSLLVEVLGRLYNILSPTDQQLYSAWFIPYLKGGEKYVYSVKSGEQQIHLESLAAVYYGIHNVLLTTYSSNPIFQMFERVYTEHFKAVEPTDDQIPILLRPKEELGSDTLQSPDDLEATFRTKRGTSYQGFVAFGAETCHPENKIDLVTKLALATNNTDDAVILEDNLEGMVDLTPDLDELHLDGGFGSKGVDTKAAPHNITLVQTAIKGIDPAVPMEIQGNEQEGFTVNCPNPEHDVVKAQKAKINFRADFDLNKCENCPFKDQCPTKGNRKDRKRIAVFRFKTQDVLRQKRHKAIQKIPKARRTLRAGVENLMGLLHRGEKHTGKLKVRGRFNFELYLFSMGVVINFERIFRYQKTENNIFTPFQMLLLPWRVSCQRTLDFQVFKLLFLKYVTHI